ncbi:MAG: tetratricopeptide repeat protein, partial [bacterium]|nr:tetratricopeptide repeat protein [bacterium]
MQSNDKRPAGRLAAMSLAMLALALVAAVSSAGDQQQIGVELDRLRLLGAAHYENDHFKDAAAAYRRILELAPEAAIDHFNLGLVLMRDSQYDAAIEALGRAVEIDPELTGAIYVRGIVYKRQGNFSAAVAGLREVIERDPQCFGALYNLGLCHKLLEEFESAQEAFNQAIELDPEHPSPYYQMVILARRGGDVEEARRLSEIFDRLRDTIDESEKTVEALERSRYSYILEAPRFGEDLEPAPDAEVRFVDVTTEALGASPARIVPPAPLPERVRRDQYDAAELGRRYAAAVGGAVALRDVDADGRLDVYAARCATSDEGSANRFYRGAGDGRFREEAAGFGLGDAHCATDALFGDLDNDGHDDLYVVNAGPNVLYR